MTIVSQFGLYKAPELPNLVLDSPLFNNNVYFILPYEPFISITAFLGNDTDVVLKITDWYGNNIDNLDDKHLQALAINESFIPIASLSGINRYQIFFDTSLTITDFVEPQGCFVTPGMLTHLFQTKYSTQKIVAKGVLNQEAIQEMIKKYDELIIKPSIKMLVSNDTKRPYYAKICKSMASHS